MKRHVPMRFAESLRTTCDGMCGEDRCERSYRHTGAHMTRAIWRTIKYKRYRARLREKDRRRRRRNPSRRTIYQRSWRAANPEKANATVEKWRLAHKEEVAAQHKVHKAVKSGLLTKSLSCQDCGKVCKTQGHHPDYSKPLEVIWVCHACHRKRHRRLP